MFDIVNEVPKLRKHVRTLTTPSIDQLWVENTVAQPVWLTGEKDVHTYGQVIGVMPNSKMAVQFMGCFYGGEREAL